MLRSESFRKAHFRPRSATRQISKTSAKSDGERPKAPSHRSLGRGDGDGNSIIEPEYLTLQDIGEDEWSELLKTAEI